MYTLTRTASRLGRGFATHASSPTKDCSTITPPYSTLLKKLEDVRNILGRDRKLTLAEKILYAHLHEPHVDLERGKKIRGEAYLRLKPQRVAMQDASAHQKFVCIPDLLTENGIRLQFMTCGLPKTAVPSSIHCDHLIQAAEGAESDLKCGKEVWDRVLEARVRYYPPNSTRELCCSGNVNAWNWSVAFNHLPCRYCTQLCVKIDSHTPNAGGLGTVAIGVGGADAVDAMTNTPWELKAPLVTGIHLTGKMGEWSTPKDLILHLAGKLTVRGGTGRILEYFGSGVHAQSCTGLATTANMGAEVGATTTVFPYTDSMRAYLHATGRGPVANAADQAAQAGYLAADEGAEYDDVIEINLSKLEPTINGPFTPDLATPLSQFGAFVKKNGWKDELSAGLIGSCTNSSYEDMGNIYCQASKGSGPQGSGTSFTPLRLSWIMTWDKLLQVPFLCTPGSEQIRATIERDGLTESLQGIGATVLANACGPCIGQWKREDKKGEENGRRLFIRVNKVFPVLTRARVAILTSFNRNFKARNDANSLTMNFLASPEIVTAISISGKLSFNPMIDSITTPSGEQFKFSPPAGDTLPKAGFTPGDLAYTPKPNPEPLPETEVVINETSSRLQVLKPFDSPFAGQSEKELKDMVCLMRVRGKCTTDHISAAVRYLSLMTRAFITEHIPTQAVNDEGGDVNVAFDWAHPPKDASHRDTIPGVAKRLKARNQSWCLVVDDNYGEGSAREHAALQPRFYGAC
ncbi:aconitate hydratase [Rhizoctonia solani AG-1 IA]|uniref:Aconitate hydratase n=1 Tax=Thanatephorus cucumeris (strain AG1-IA) TaxID=983506 RepID=L8X2H9_THACA|nr:aconitate hydratase [Rhizoctonia solani AG-1 IA]